MQRFCFVLVWSGYAAGSMQLRAHFKIDICCVVKFILYPLKIVEIKYKLILLSHLVRKAILLRGLNGVWETL